MAEEKKKVDDGGPAYPVDATEKVGGPESRATRVVSYKGMSLRDRVALEIFARSVMDEGHQPCVEIEDLIEDPKGSYIIAEYADREPYVALVQRDIVGNVLPGHEKETRYRCERSVEFRHARDALRWADGFIEARKAGGA